MEKRCLCCGEIKPITRFFFAPKDGAASWHGTSRFCIDCHDAGLIVHGYGWYGDKYRKPDWIGQK